MKRVSVVGSLNIDHVLKVKALPKKGETLVVKSYSLSCGGKGANQAIAIARLGVFVNMIGKIGGDELGDILIKNLKKSDVRVDGVMIDENKKTGVAFITVDENGSNTIVVAPGANSRLSIEAIETKKEKLEESDVVVLQMEIPIDTVSYVIDMVKKWNKMVILNLSPAKDININTLAKVDYLVVNETELEYLTRVNFDFDNIDSAVRIIRKFFTNNLIITFGGKGAICITSDEQVLRIPTYNVIAVDSTGAGDAFIGGLVKGLVENKNIEQCIKIGNAVGSLSVTKLGAQNSFPFEKELDMFLKSNKSSFNF